MKQQTKNRLKAVYLAWVLLHLVLLLIAEPSKSANKHIFPFYEDKYKSHDYYGVVQTYYGIKPFQLDRVYDLTEFLFYAIVPILIYYIITLFNSKDQTPQ